MIDFQRYLAAKKSVDDRALNRLVWQRLRGALLEREFNRPLRILELGCGIGTMVERLLAWGLADTVDYLGIDAQAENIEAAQDRFWGWATGQGYRVEISSQKFTLKKDELHWQIRFQQADAITFQARLGYYDLLIAQAFLDLVAVPSALQIFRQWVALDGLFYFTINFDGETIFEPVPDQALEAKIIACYHQSMDVRLVDGNPSGDSRTGRHLFTHLNNAGIEILAGGSSDWVVYPGQSGYLADEAYFLGCILDFFAESLTGNPDIDPEELAAWLAERRAQIQDGKLIYIAHQLDFLAKNINPG